MADTGFNLHAGVRVEGDLARERLCRYALRPALALSRLRHLPDGRVAYRVKRSRAGKGTNGLVAQSGAAWDNVYAGGGGVPNAITCNATEPILCCD